MSKRVFQCYGFSPPAFADTTNLTNANYMAIASASSTTGLNVVEIFLGGQATASNVMQMQWARDSTVGASLAALAVPFTDGPMNSFANALGTAVASFTNATTNPQRTVATTAARLPLSFNAFGGIVRWVAAPGEEWGIVGTAVNVSESSLSNFTGGATAAISAHIVYEPM